MMALINMNHQRWIITSLIVNISNIDRANLGVVAMQCVIINRTTSSTWEGREVGDFSGNVVHSSCSLYLHCRLARCMLCNFSRFFVVY